MCYKDILVSSGIRSIADLQIKEGVLLMDEDKWCLKSICLSFFSGLNVKHNLHNVTKLCKLSLFTSSIIFLNLHFKMHQSIQCPTALYQCFLLLWHTPVHFLAIINYCVYTYLCQQRNYQPFLHQVPLWFQSGGHSVLMHAAAYW